MVCPLPSKIASNPDGSTVWRGSQPAPPFQYRVAGVGLPVAPFGVEVQIRAELVAYAPGRTAANLPVAHGRERRRIRGRSVHRRLAVTVQVVAHRIEPRQIRDPVLMPPGTEVEPLRPREYSLLAPGMVEPVRVTTEAAYYEENSEGVELWSPGNPLFTPSMDGSKPASMTSWSYCRAAFGWRRGSDRATVAVRSPRR